MVYAIVLTFTTLLITGYFLFRIKNLQRTAAKLNRTLTEVQESVAKEQARNRQLKTSLQHQLESNEALLKTERKRIAADLHDDIIQRMILVRLRIEQLLFFPLPVRAENEIKSLHRDMENILADIRYLIDDLVHPKFETQSFSALIRELAAQLSRIFYLKVEFKVQHEQDEFFIPPYIKRELYYIIREAAQNSLNHSIASVLIISLSWQDGLWVVIRDDGQGLLQHGRGKGYGTESMKRRAEAIGAELIIKNRMPGLVIMLGYKNSQ